MAAQVAETRCPIGRQMPVRTRVNGEAGNRPVLAIGVLIGAGSRVEVIAMQAGETLERATMEVGLATKARAAVVAETALGIVAFPVVAALATPALLEVVREVSVETAREPAVRVAHPAWGRPVAAVGAAGAADGVDE
jgi:hypothetical protein